MRYLPYFLRPRQLFPALLLAVAFALPATAATDTVAAARPELALHALSGDDVFLSEFHGEVVVVNFWATWCIPCREELPLLESLSREYAGDSVRFVAVSTDEASTRDRIPAAVEEAGVTFDIWIGATTLDMKRFELGTELPATLVLGCDGTVVARLFGVVSEVELREQIDRAINKGANEQAVAAAVHADDDSCCDHEEEDSDHGGDATGPDAHEHDHDHDHDGEDAHAHADAAVAEDNASLVPS